MSRVATLALLLLVLATTGQPAHGQNSGTFGVISDIHFDPFDPPGLAASLARSAPAAWPAAFAAATKDQAMSAVGKDTNHALLASSIAAFARATAGADFALVTGDLLVHEFNRTAAAALGVDPASPAVADLAVKTSLFVVDAVGGALAGKPVIVALGNEDSSCGDYRVEPGGAYLLAMREAVRRLVGAERLLPDFDATYAAAGYYAVRHPTVANGLIVVLNDVLWSRHYRDDCPLRGPGAGEAMLGWLREQLARQRTAGGAVWMVHHIPWGIDAYSTVHANAASCAAKAVPFLREPFASALSALLVEYRDVVRASFSGHTHFDGYRLLTDRVGTIVGLNKITPAVSPIYGQYPGFQVFTYDRQSVAPTDFSTWHLSSPATAWRLEYTFTNAYGQPRYGPDIVAAVWQSMAKGGAARDIYRRLYTVGRSEPSADDLAALVCALGHIDVASFTACYCGGR